MQSRIFAMSCLMLWGVQVNAQSIYERVESQFQEAGSVTVADFHADVFLAGKCVSQRKPGRLQGGALVVFVEHDRLLGQSNFSVVLQEDMESFYLDLTPIEVLKLTDQSRGDADRSGSMDSMPASEGKPQLLGWRTYHSSQMRNPVAQYVLKKTAAPEYYFLKATPYKGQSTFYCYFTQDKLAKTKPVETLAEPAKKKAQGAKEREGLK